MWLGGMDRISHHLKGESNQPQSLATGSCAFESQCFISKHKLLDRGSFFLFYCRRLYSEEKVVTVRRSEGGCGVYICNVPPGPWSGFLWLLAGSSCGWSNHVCRISHWFPPLANRGGSFGEILSILTNYPLELKNDHILRQWYSNFWAAIHDWCSVMTGGDSGATLNTITIVNVWPADGANLTTNHLKTPLMSGRSLS